MKLRFSFSILTLLLMTMLPTLAQDDPVTLRIGHFFFGGAGFDPIDQATRGRMFYFDVMYDTLVAQDADGEIQPRLATAWEQTPQSLTLTLREGVVFSDGTPLDAEAVQANLERYRLEDAPLTNAELASVDSIDVLDEYTVRLNLNKNDELLLGRLSSYSGMMVSPAAFETTSEVPVGAGPFILDDFIDSSFYAFNRNETYWDVENIPFDRVEIRLVGAADVVNGLLAGDQDMVFTVGGLARLVDTEVYNTIGFDSTIYGLVFWDRDGEMHPEFADQRVRCALSHAIDPQAYTPAIEGPLGSPIYTMPPPGTYGYNPDAPITEFNLELARTLLEEAGLADLAFTTGTADSVANRHEAILGFWDEAGIDVETVRHPTADYPLIAENSSYPVTMLAINMEHFSIFVEDYFLPDGSINPFGATDEDILALYNEAQTLSLSEAEPLYQQISAILTERCYIKPIAVGSAIAIFAPGVTGEGRFRTNAFIDVRTIRMEQS